MNEISPSVDKLEPIEDRGGARNRCCSQRADKAFSGARRPVSKRKTVRAVDDVSFPSPRAKRRIVGESAAASRPRAASDAPDEARCRRYHL